MTLSEREKQLIINALLYYRSTQGSQDLYNDCSMLASRIHTKSGDPADDGPEVGILRRKPSAPAALGAPYGSDDGLADLIEAYGRVHGLSFQDAMYRVMASRIRE